MTQQPIWKYAGKLGDVDPIAYGGGFVYTDETGVYRPECTVFLPGTDEQWKESGDATPVTVYRFTLDRCSIVTDASTPNGEYLVPFGFDARADLPHPILSYRQWFDSWDGDGIRTSNKLASVAESNGMPESELRQMFTSDNPVTLALAYQMLGEYHGWENLDSYPLTMAESEAYTRYAEEMKR